MNRILGIDYGSKRIGIAVSDETRHFALPVNVLRASDAAVREVVEIARQYQATEVVIGESRDYQMRPNPIFEQADTFKRALEDAGLTVHLELEFMTSQNAERLQGKNEMTDASAAALILQSYLDRTKN